MSSVDELIDQVMVLLAGYNCMVFLAEDESSEEAGMGASIHSATAAPPDMWISFILIAVLNGTKRYGEEWLEVLQKVLNENV